ncbi:hypothetical protein Ciccas_013601, partial [Cichlidogyrus casuarinus]
MEEQTAKEGSEKMVSAPRESSQRTRFHRDTRKANKVECVMTDSSKKLPKALMKNIRRPVNRGSQAKTHALKQSAAGKWKKSIDYEVEFFYEDSDEEDRLTPPMDCCLPLGLQPIEHAITVPLQEEDQDFEELEDDGPFLSATLELGEEDLEGPSNYTVTWNPPEKAQLRLTGFDALKAKYPTYQLGNGTPRTLTLDLTPYLDPSSELAAHRRDHCPNSSRIASLCVSNLENASRDLFAVNFQISWSYSGLAQATALQDWLSSIERQNKPIRIEALIVDFLDGFLPRVVSETPCCLILLEAGVPVLASGEQEVSGISPQDLSHFLGEYDSGDDLAMICGACLDFIEQDGYLQLDECDHILCAKCWTQHLYGCLEDVFKIPAKGREYLQRLVDMRSIFNCPVEHCTSCPNRSAILKFLNASVLNPIFRAMDFAHWMLDEQSQVSPDEALFACPEKSCSRIFHCPAQLQGNVKGIECGSKALLPLCCSTLLGILHPWPALDPKSPNCLYYKHEFHWPASCQEASLYHSALTTDSDSALSNRPHFARILEARSLRT